MQQVNIVPEIHIPSSPVWRVLNPSAVARIFGNIINNAVKYSDGDLLVNMEDDGRIYFLIN